MFERGWQRVLTLTIFLAPSLIGMIVFALAPIVVSFGLSFTQWDLLTPPKFIGLGNFRKLLGDSEFWSALRHTVQFLLGYIPLVMIFGLLLAVALHSQIPARGFFRAVYFLPVVTSWVAVALVWKWLLNPNYGLINNLLKLIGIKGPAWLFDPAWAMPAVIMTSVWKDLGFIMIILLAGLQGIPREFNEAASIDGASKRQQLFHITIPLLMPAIFFSLSISLINSFQVFDQVFVMTAGGPAGATTVLVERIVKHAFSFSNMGYAAAMSWVLFVFIVLTTLIFARLQRRWSL